jgi:hypothetical protein
MRRPLLTAICCSLALSICAAKDPNQPPSSERDGSTPKKAVIISGPLKGYVQKEWRWIAQHYPGSKMLPYEQALIMTSETTYVDSITFTTAAGKRQTIYFDISRVK